MSLKPDYTLGQYFNSQLLQIQAFVIIFCICKFRGNNFLYSLIAISIVLSCEL